MLAVIAVTLGAVVALAGSGGGGGGSDVEKVKQTLTRELMAVAGGDGVTACSLATPGGQARLAKSIPGASCQQVVSLLAERLPPAIKEGLGSAQVNHVTISGDTATVQDSDITSTRGSLAGFLHPGSAPTVLTKQPDGTWKVSG